VLSHIILPFSRLQKQLKKVSLLNFQRWHKFVICFHLTYCEDLEQLLEMMHNWGTHLYVQKNSRGERGTLERVGINVRQRFRNKLTF
jgi:hypothetical protein